MPMTGLNLLLLLEKMVQFISDQRGNHLTIIICMHLVEDRLLLMQVGHIQEIPGKRYNSQASYMEESPGICITGISAMAIIQMNKIQNTLTKNLENILQHFQ